MTMRNVSFHRWLLLLAGFLVLSSAALAQVSIGVSVRTGPPPLPVYEQPLCPGEGFIWIPGYWAWGPDGFFWVPGTWVIAPVVGYLWTPGYWGWADGFYVWYPGYWGPRVGFYGGINYGFGYTGVGYAGGYWRGGNFVYNRAVNNVNVTEIHNTYNEKVINNNVTVNRVSYNGGPSGVTARPTPAEQAAAREQHIAPTTEQTQHEHVSASNRSLLASTNHGQPPVAATPKPGVFTGRDVVPARTATPNERRSERPTLRNENPDANRPPSVEGPRGQNPGAYGRPEAERPKRNSEPEGPRARPNNAPEQPRGNRPPAEQPQSRPRQQQNNSQPRGKRNDGERGDERRP
jgi:hypothetical protein